MTDQPITSNIQNLLTVEDVAAIFRVSKLTIRRWSDKGTLKAIRINKRGDRRFLTEDIQEVLTAREMVADIYKAASNDEA